MIFGSCGVKAYLFSQSVVRLTEESEVPGSVTGPEHTFVETDMKSFHGHLPLNIYLITKLEIAFYDRRDL